MHDLSELTTESRNTATEALDSMSALEIVTVMNQEDKKVPTAVEAVLPQVARAAQMASKAVLTGGRIIYVGAGTSGRLGVLDAVECVPTFGVQRGQVIALIAGGDGAFVCAAEGAEDDRGAGQRDLEQIGLRPEDFVLGIAASGRTPYVCAALAYARRKGCITAALTCNRNTELGSLVELPIEVVVGPEVLTGSTRLKAGTAQKMVLNMISTAAMVLCGKVYENLMVDVVQTNEKLHIRARNIVRQATGASEETVRAALREANGNTKTAVTMILAGTSAEKAEELLGKSLGHVRFAVAMAGGAER